MTGPVALIGVDTVRATGMRAQADPFGDHPHPRLDAPGSVDPSKPETTEPRAGSAL